MEESLRLAYLAAMDIPVWLLRGSEVAASAPAPVPEAAPSVQGLPPPAAPAAEAPAARFARDLLGADEPRGAAAVARATARGKPAARVPERPAADVPPSLLLVSAGRFLFIDQASDAAADRRTVELLGALALALGGERVTPRAQGFDLQALGAAGDRARARDVLLGRLAKLSETESFEHLVLLGPGPAGLLLGWDAARYAGRVPHVHRVPGLEPGVLVTVSSAQMFADPAQKRVAWEELGAARSRRDV